VEWVSPEDRECYLVCLAHREEWDPTDLADQWEEWDPMDLADQWEEWDTGWLLAHFREESPLRRKSRTS